MKKSLSILAVAALALAACGGSDVVATVDGTEIHQSDVESLVQNDGVMTDSAFATELLNAVIEVVVIEQASNQFGITFTDAQIDEKLAEFNGLIEDQGMTLQEFLDQQGRTEDWLRRVAHQQLIFDAVENSLFQGDNEITDQDLQDQYQSQLYALTNACVSHILVATQEEADAVEARLAGGEDFAAVAADVSTDGSASNGGDLGCSTLDRYVVEFAQGVMDAVVGEPTQPVHSQFGYHIILVTERTTSPFDEVKDELRSQVESLRRGTLLQDWLLQVLDEADVSVVEEYGTWVTDPAPQVLPPQ